MRRWNLRFGFTVSRVPLLRSWDVSGTPWQYSVRGVPDGQFLSDRLSGGFAVSCAGHFSNQSGLRSAMQCSQSAPGRFAVAGSTTQTLCSAGSYALGHGNGLCTPCHEGTYAPEAGLTNCLPCIAGHTCPQGSSIPLPASCPAGFYVLSNFTSINDCEPCTIAHFCFGGSAQPEACGVGTFANETGTARCHKCAPGSYQPSEGSSSCLACTTGHWCAEGATTPIPCPAGTVSNATSLASAASCEGVAFGFWAPLGSSLSEACPASGFYCPGAREDDVNSPPGSRPILIPVGASIAEEQVEVVEQQMTLAVDISSFNQTAFRHEMAALYNVDPSLIEVSASAGSTAVSITIAIPPFAGTASTNATSILALMSDTNLVASLSAMTGLVISSATTPAATTQMRSVELVCPAGHWCTAGLTVPCSVGYYNPNQGANNQTACIRCPENSITSAEGATSKVDCTCTAGFLSQLDPLTNELRCECGMGYGLVRVGGAESCQACAVGYFKRVRGNLRCEDCARDRTTLEAGAISNTSCTCKAGLYRNIEGDCQPCPTPGTACVEPGETVQTLPLVGGYWRARDSTDVLHRCYTEGFCPHANGSACADGHSGPFCEVCETNFYRSGFGGCIACEGSQELAMALPIAVLAVIALALACLLRSAKRRSVQAVLRRLDALADAALKQDGDIADGLASELSKEANEIITDFEEAATKESHLREATYKIVRVARRQGKKMATGGGVFVKLKILISLFQVLNGVGAVFDIPFPPMYTQFLRIALLFEFNLPAVLPLHCWFRFNFHASLILQTVWPLIVVGLLGLLSLVLAAAGRQHENQRAKNAARLVRDSKSGKRASQADAALLTASLATQWSQQCLNFAFLLMFLVYPSNVARIFTTFLCIDLPESGQSFLRKDFSIECSSSRHQWIRYAYATPMCVIYPVGVPMLLGAVFLRHRAQLLYWRDEEDRANAYAKIKALAEHTHKGHPELEQRHAQDQLAAATDVLSPNEVRIAAKEDEKIPTYVKRATAGYELHYFYFEAVEMVRKLLLVGIAVAFDPGSLAQATYGLVVCFFCFGLYALCSPYVDRGEDRLAQLCQILIFVVLLSSIVLRADRGEETGNGLDILLTVMTALPMVAAVFLETPLLDLVLMCHSHLVSKWMRRVAALAGNITTDDVASTLADSRPQHSKMRQQSVDIAAAEVEHYGVVALGGHGLDYLQRGGNTDGAAGTGLTRRSDLESVDEEEGPRQILTERLASKRQQTPSLTRRAMAGGGAAAAAKALPSLRPAVNQTHRGTAERAPSTRRASTNPVPAQIAIEMTAASSERSVAVSATMTEDRLIADPIKVTSSTPRVSTSPASGRNARTPANGGERSVLAESGLSALHEASVAHALMDNEDEKKDHGLIASAVALESDGRQGIMKLKEQRSTEHASTLLDFVDEMADGKVRPTSIEVAAHTAMPSADAMEEPTEKEAQEALPSSRLKSMTDLSPFRGAIDQVRSSFAGLSQRLMSPRARDEPMEEASHLNA